MPLSRCFKNKETQIRALEEKLEKDPVKIMTRRQVCNQMPEKIEKSTIPGHILNEILYSKFDSNLVKYATVPASVTVPSPGALSRWYLC
jgi:hypothetical protein